MIRKLWRTILVMAVLLLATLYGLSSTWPEPEIWHTVNLDEEFNRDKLDEVDSFKDYLALERRLYAQLELEVYANTPRGADHRLERFSTGSTADPTRRDPNWNRSFELEVEEPRGAVLLLHGMSDSPYSLRGLGQSLHARGYQVLGLRLPGHGTAPSGLLNVHWRDMAAAVELAMEHLAEKVGDKSIHIIGYSTGAPLALNYALDTEIDPLLKAPSSLILVSPALGISPAAVLAQWNRRLSYMPGLEHLAWLDMLPEFDPYKYNSFATNAAEQVHLLTRAVAARINERNETGTAPPLPHILVLKSTVDATVSTHAVVDNLLRHVNVGRHEFILFDINRQKMTSSILVSDPGPLTNELMNDAELPFTLTVISNENPETDTVIARHKPPLSVEVSSSEPLDAVWPNQIVSLSHIALPFAPDDPLYGSIHPHNDEEIYLGHVAIQGERGLLKFSSDWLIRLRHNPFYEYFETRILDWVDRAGAD
jgi:alpha-beta hydrolase superfamily lysophospholipase